jgi:predicted nucleotidyltransferase
VSQAELLRTVIELLDTAGIPHMVVGSYASSFHGEPRMTRDIDLVVDPSEEALHHLIDLVDLDRFYVSDVMDAYHSRSMFNLIEPRTGWKIDFVLRRDRPFSLAEFERRIPARIGEVDVYLASAEDTMLAKLEWGKASSSDRQLDDAVAIAVTQDVDIHYLAEWADELGIAEELNSALERAASLRADKSGE